MLPAHSSLFGSFESTAEQSKVQGSLRYSLGLAKVCVTLSLSSEQSWPEGSDRGGKKFTFASKQPVLLWSSFNDKEERVQPVKSFSEAAESWTFPFKTLSPSGDKRSGSDCWVFLCKFTYLHYPSGHISRSFYFFNEPVLDWMQRHRLLVNHKREKELGRPSVKTLLNNIKSSIKKKMYCSEIIAYGDYSERLFWKWCSQNIAHGLIQRVFKCEWYRGTICRGVTYYKHLVPTKSGFCFTLHENQQQIPNQFPAKADRWHIPWNCVGPC